jgi:hypothetical protein
MFARLYSVPKEQFLHKICEGILQSIKNLPVKFGLLIISQLLLTYLKNHEYLKRKDNKNVCIDEQSWQQLFSKYQRTFFYVVVIGPVVEEFIFRGILMNAIRIGLKSLNIDQSYSLILSAMAFGYAHKKKARLSATYSGYQYAKLAVNNGGNLLPSIAAHITHNFLTTTLDFWQQHSSDKQFEQAKKEINQNQIKYYQERLDQIDEKLKQAKLSDELYNDLVPFRKFYMDKIQKLEDEVGLKGLSNLI